jgi:hypothetical protein
MVGKSSGEPVSGMLLHPPRSNGVRCRREPFCRAYQLNAALALSCGQSAHRFVRRLRVFPAARGSTYVSFTDRAGSRLLWFAPLLLHPGLRCGGNSEPSLVAGEPYAGHSLTGIPLRGIHALRFCGMPDAWIGEAPMSSKRKTPSGEAEGFRESECGPNWMRWRRCIGGFPRVKPLSSKF